jgi:SAM-dependent methyltransferase
MPSIDNQEIYDANWVSWVEMKKHGPASCWLRGLVANILKESGITGNIKTVLDLGCGEGSTTAFLARILTNANVLGIDISKEGIECSKRNYNFPNLEFLFDPDSSNLERTFDLITSFEVLEHVDDWETLLKRMTQSAEKYLLLSFPTGRMRNFEKIFGHFRNFKKGEIEEFLSLNGFEPLIVYYAGFPFYSPMYRELCNLTNSRSNVFTHGQYTKLMKIATMPLYLLFNYFSTRDNFGDQFCGLFLKKNG